MARTGGKAIELHGHYRRTLTRERESIDAARIARKPAQTTLRRRAPGARRRKWIESLGSPAAQLGRAAAATTNAKTAVEYGFGCGGHVVSSAAPKQFATWFS
eukprot:3932743-Pleurochrysis_carterae.AAC.1